MAFQTGTSTTIENLITQLGVFLVANGWTQDFLTLGEPGRGGWHRANLFVAFQWTEVSSGGVLAIYQNLSNDDSTNVWLSTGDSGRGAASALAASLSGGRCIFGAAGPHAAYYFFEQDANPNYCHIVLEVDTGIFRHFGFGNLEKVGDWVGGEYCYGQVHGFATNAIDNPVAQTHCFMLEGGTSSAFLNRQSMHVEGFPEQAVTDKWMCVGGVGNFPQTTDRAGFDCMAGMGSGRGGPAAHFMSVIPLSLLTAFKPLFPMPLFMSNQSAAPDILRLMGTHPDVRIVNMANIDPGDTFTIAGETWYVFPWLRKQYLKNDTIESWNAGYAYRQETA